ncbi:MAG: DNA methyltransferase [Acidimicrobiales bacterium]|jgi:DNA modification methylase
MPVETETGVLYCNDNLERLAVLPDECVDLIYLDPPFFSNRVYEVIWGDEAEVRSFEDRWEGGIQHYVGWMRDRVAEMYRVLKSAGSLYLHCDPHASHYLKVMLDQIFGMSNFQDEIVWERTNAHNMRSKVWPRVNDVILFYTKTRNGFTFNPQYTAYGPEQLGRFKKDREGRLYKAENLTFSTPNATRQFEWRGTKPPPNRSWGFSLEQLEEMYAEGRILLKRDGSPRMDGWKIYLEETKGKLVGTNWTDIERISNTAAERLGYPTQKPEALLERIIRASSNQGDIILDPFCGCGTTVSVAHALKRQWIGIDISPTAMEIMRRRLWNQRRFTPVIVDVPETEDELRYLKPFEFQNYVINALNGTHSPKKTGDMGVDGYWFFTRDPIQVKQQEHVGRPILDEFETAMHREKATVGYVVAFSFTRGAVEEVARAQAENGLNVRLIRVKELLMMTRRPGNPLEKFGPQPEGDVIPLPPQRKPSELPTAEELVASDRSVG